jgi:conjugative relaxase-like TrwC/TraI family protein
MLTAKNRTAHEAIDYYSHSQNFDTSLTTRWYGKGAIALGLSGEINSKEAFANICNGLTPNGSQKLGNNTKRAAFDCTFSAPKSVSLSALVGGDKRLVTAHHHAVEQALAAMEKHHAQTRIRLGSTRYSVNTGNLIVAQFDHIESRELDPHLHTHALVMNLTQVESSDRWYSLHNEEIYKNKKPLGMLYQAHLRAEVEKLGYETEARSHGQFEIKGYKADDLVEFSKRRQQIIAKVGANATWETRENAWSITRRAKQHLPADELKELWCRQALDLGIVPVVPEIQTYQQEQQERIANASVEYELQQENIEPNLQLQRGLRL